MQMYVNYHNYYANFTPPDNFCWGEPYAVFGFANFFIQHALSVSHWDVRVQKSQWLLVKAVLGPYQQFLF